MRLICIFLACALSAYAGVEEYFKNASDKFCSHAMKNIDCIYMINLDERPEKYASAMALLAPYDIVPYRFSAVNGWNLPTECFEDLGVKFGPWMNGGKWGTYYPSEEKGSFVHEPIHTHGRTYFSHCMAKGAIGCILSHLSVLQDAYDSGHETIWIIEDDIEVIRNPHLLSDLIEELDLAVGKKGWDVLFTDQDTINNDGNRVPCSSYAWRPNFTPAHSYRFAEKYPVSDRIRRIGSRYGSYSMIVRRSGMKKILNFFKQYQIFLPYDMEYTQPDDIRLFTVLDDVVSTQAGAPSDNGGANYKINEQ